MIFETRAPFGNQSTKTMASELFKQLVNYEAKQVIMKTQNKSVHTQNWKQLPKQRHLERKNR